jgi:Trypsin
VQEAAADDARTVPGAPGPRAWRGRGPAVARAWSSCLLATSAVALIAGAASPDPSSAASPARARASHRGQPTPGHGAYTARPRARAAIVGGNQISITQAPWQVLVLTGKALCGGSIIDITHVLTAAHCATDPKTRQPLPPEGFEVIAGRSRVAPEPSEERRGVLRVRVHPYWTGSSPDADDVAVLELDEALETSPALQPVGVAGPGVGPPEGTAVQATGFGQQDPFANQPPDGNLYALSMRLGYSRTCGFEANALFVCASAVGGTVCFGDSGGGLTNSGPPAALLGVIDFLLVAEDRCPAGSLDGFANVTAPEIGKFLEGSESPPRAPRGGGAVIWGAPSVGRLLTCEPGSWSNGPSFTYAFIDRSTGQALQRGGASGYALSAQDVGRSIMCEVQAANEGGTGVGRTPPLGPVTGTVALPPPSAPPVLPAPPPARAVEAAISLFSTNVAVRRDGSALVRLRCRGTAACRGAIALTASRIVHIAGKRKLRAVRIGSVGYSIAGERVTAIRLRLNAIGRALLRAARGNLRARMTFTLLAAGASPAQTQVRSVRLLQARTR